MGGGGVRRPSVDPPLQWYSEPSSFNLLATGLLLCLVPCLVYNISSIQTIQYSEKEEGETKGHNAVGSFSIQAAARPTLGLEMGGRMKGTKEDAGRWLWLEFVSPVVLLVVLLL